MSAPKIKRNLEIVKKYIPKKYGLKRLAKEYGLSHITIRDIVQNPQKWRELAKKKTKRNNRRG